MLEFLVPGPLTVICSWIPLCGFSAPACMYVDRLLLGCTGTMTGGSLWGDTGISGILAACLGGGGFWGFLYECLPWNCCLPDCSSTTGGDIIGGGLGIGSCADRCTEFCAGGIDMIFGGIPGVDIVAGIVKNGIKMSGDVCSLCCGG